MNLTAKNRSVLFLRLGLSLGVFLALLAEGMSESLRALWAPERRTRR